jgi:rhomboid protease GluP
MSQSPDEDEAAMRRMEREIGQQRKLDDHQGPPPSPIEPSGPDPYMPRAVRVPAAARPLLSWLLLGAIIAIYLLSAWLSGNLFEPSLAALIVLGAKENSLIAGGELWRLLGATFLHGNLVHLFFNSYALFALGPDCERIYGRARFLAIYLLAGIGGSVASYLFSPAPSVGASGAIFGLMGALGLFFYLNREAFGVAGREQMQSIIAIGMINLFIGFSAPGRIDNFGHLGGLIAGLLAGLALAPRFAVERLATQIRVVRRFPAWGWGAAAALGLALVGLAALLPGAGP